MVPPAAAQAPVRAPERLPQPSGPSWSQRHWSKVLSGYTHKRKQKAADAARVQRRLLSRAQEDGVAKPNTASRPGTTPADTQALLSMQGTPDVVYEKLLHDSFQQQLRVAAQDLTRLDVVAARLLQLSSELDADVSIVARMVWKEGSVLLVHPKELRGRIRAVAQALGVSEQEALSVAARDPRLLLRPAAVLQKHLATSAAILKLRGLPALSELAARRPAILRNNSPAALAAKVDALRPALGGLPAEVAQAVLTACPGLLRRSPQCVHRRYQGLLALLPGLPRDIIADLILTAPDLLNISTNTLRAKFRTLLTKYGAFRDDVVDVVLVDPLALLNAEPTWGNTGSVTIRTSGSRTVHSGSGSIRTGSSSTATTGSKHASVNSGSSSNGGKGSSAQHSSSSGRVQDAVGGSNTHASSTSNNSSDQVGVGAPEGIVLGSSPSKAVPAGPHTPSSTAAQAGPIASRISSQLSSPSLPKESAAGQLISWASAVGVPLYDVLQLYARTAPAMPNTSTTTWTAEASFTDTSPSHQSEPSALVVQDTAGEVIKFKSLPSQLQVVAAVLGLSVQQAKLVVGRATGILGLSKSELRGRVAALADVIAAGSDTELSRKVQPQAAAKGSSAAAVAAEAQSTSSSAHARGTQQRHSISMEVQALVMQQPELLLQAAGETAACIAVLQQQLGLDTTRGLRLLQQQPRLLLLPSSGLQGQLQDLQTALGGVSTRMLGELVLKEPGLLDTPCEVVGKRYASISASFGSFNDDALGVVLADPSILLRPETDASLPSITSMRRRADLSQQVPRLRDKSPPLTGQGGQRNSSTGKGSGNEAEAAAAAALDAIVKAESETARRVKPSRSKKRQAGQESASQ